MTTSAIFQHKPLIFIGDRFQGINWGWWLKRIPLALLAIPASYGVSQFGAMAGLPNWVAYVAGAAFEATYLGAIAMADQQHDDEDRQTTILWWAVNVAAVVASVLSNLLYFAGGEYSQITAEVATHAIPLPLLGFFYGLLLHRTSAKAAARAAQAQAEQLARELEAAEVVHCRYCGQACKNQQAEYSHFRTCSKHPKNVKE